jgi:hypothetical protein
VMVVFMVVAICISVRATSQRRTSSSNPIGVASQPTS